MSIVEQIIRKNANAGVLMSPEEFKKLSNANVSWHHFNRPYFFFQRELDMAGFFDEKEYQSVKNQLIRHLIPYGQGYYDYIAHKEYATLNEWAKDNSWTLNDIRYGVVKKHRGYFYTPVVACVTLDTLIKHLDPHYEEVPYVYIPRAQTDKEKLISQIQGLLDTLKNMA